MHVCVSPLIVLNCIEDEFNTAIEMLVVITRPALQMPKYCLSSADD